MAEKSATSIQVDDLIGKTRETKNSAEKLPSYFSDESKSYLLQRKDSCACGGGCPICKTKNTNLPISNPADASEIEADQIADKVMQKQVIEPKNSGNKLHRKETGKSNSFAPRIVRDVLSSAGKPLPPETRSFMESRFDHDFGGVKIHDDGKAAESASSINARAFTSGSDIVFNSGQYNPNSEPGKRLLAHELAHVVQQNSSVRRQSADAPAARPTLNFTEELIDLSASEELAQPEARTPDELKEPEAIERVADEPEMIIQRAPGDGQPAPTPAAPAAPAAPVRQDLVFIMGDRGGFFAAAKVFFKQHHPGAKIVDFKDRTLAGIFSELRTRVSDTAPAGNIYIVSHANQDGTLTFPMHSKDKDDKTSFGELKDALKNKASMFELAGGIDDQTFVHIKGCNIGRNVDMLNVLDEAFGGKDKVDAPTHRQGYEFHTTKVDKKNVTVSTEFFNKFVVEYTGKEDKDTDALVADFMEKYSELGYGEHEWKMMVMGAKNYNASVGKEAKAKKAAIDKDTKEKKKGIDKGDKDALKALDAGAKVSKAEVDDWLKEMKKTNVAAKSPGVKKKVILKFTATVYNDVDPTLAPAKVVPSASWKKTIPEGFKFKKCTAITPTDSGFSFVYDAENKKTKDTESLIYEPPAFPKTDDDVGPLADEALAQSIEKNPEFEVSRREMYSWRAERSKSKGFVTIKAFLEMTQYTIDVDLKETTGKNIDPKSKEGEEFYFGESTFE